MLEPARCPQCGSQIDIPDIQPGQKIICPQCSTTFEYGSQPFGGFQQPSQQPPFQQAPPPGPGSYQQAPYQQGPYQQPPMPPQPGYPGQFPPGPPMHNFGPPPPKPENYLVWAILSTLCCCLPFGIVAIIYAASVDSKYNAGDFFGASEASENAKKWCWVAFIVGIIANVIGGIAQFAAHSASGW